MSTVLYWILFLAVIASAILIYMYNVLQTKGHLVREGHSNVMVCMKKRVDLANKLVDIARSYGEHEKLTHLTISQNDMAVGQVMATLKNFPELRANQTYQQLMAQYDTIEVDLQHKREGYNAVVREYNTTLTKFPMVLVAPSLGFRPAQYFDVVNADALENLKDFQTDDGTILKEKFAQVGSKVRDASISIGTHAIQAGKDLVEKGIEIASPGKDESLTPVESENRDECFFCKECGVALAVSDKFCARCGLKV